MGQSVFGEGAYPYTTLKFTHFIQIVISEIIGHRVTEYTFNTEFDFSE